MEQRKEERSGEREEWSGESEERTQSSEGEEVVRKRTRVSEGETEGKVKG